MSCKQAASYMHDYLDNTIEGSDAVWLKQHLERCPECMERFKQMQLTDAWVRTLPTPPTSDDLAARIMNSLPRRRRHVWLEWVRRRPALTAAAIFGILMICSLLAVQGQEKDLVVRGSDLDGLVIEGRTVIVPEGSKITGNITVENGEMEVFGEVDGDLTVIDGTIYQASTANISGQVTKINQAVDWLWYKLESVYSRIIK